MSNLSICPLNKRPESIKKQHIESYLKTLSLLKKKRILGDSSVYAPIGFDFFPALVTKVFGFNNRVIEKYNFFEIEIKKWLGNNINAFTAKLNRNLKYFCISNVKDVNGLKEKLTLNGFFSIPGNKSLILKGVMIDLFEKEFDPNTERYYHCLNPLSEGKAWLELMLGLFKRGDYIVAFNDDIKLFPNPRCKEVSIETPTDLLLNQYSEILIGSPYTATTRLYLPSEFKIFKIIN